MDASIITPVIIYTVLSLSVVGTLAGIILYLVARQFKVHEDPRIHQVEAVLPGVNCGACGYPGCRGFAEACVKGEDLSGKFCPVGGQECMNAVAKILGRKVETKDVMVAVVRCAGAKNKRSKTSHYDSVPTCAIAHLVYGGETACAYGCLGFGDCVRVCPFDAIHMDPATGLPVVNEDKCTACGACVMACPKGIIELRKKGPKGRRIFVSCVNRDKGPVARRACQVACIGCGRCVKECPFEAITLENNLAYIDSRKCKLCKKCVAVCPTHAIQETNFSPKPAVPSQNPIGT